MPPRRAKSTPHLLSQQAALERQALDQLRRGDLRGARGTLGVLSELRPADDRVTRRLAQVEALIDKRESARARIASEPLRFAHAYIKSGRLEEGLKLLRAALAQDPGNARLRELALQVARRLKQRAEDAPNSARVKAEREAAEVKLRAQTQPAMPKVDLPPKRERRRGPPPRFPPPSAASVAPQTQITAGTADPKTQRLEQLLERVRSRRRHPSRWIYAS